MKQTVYDKAFALLERMLESRNEDLDEKVVYLSPGYYLLINIDRVTREDLSKRRYTDDYVPGEPVKLTLTVAKRNCDEVYKSEIPYPKEQDIMEELPRIIHMFT